MNDPIVLADADVRQRLTRGQAVDAVRADLLAVGGAQSSRQVVDAGDRRVVVTGAIDGGQWLGVRVRPGGVEDDVAIAWGPDGHLAVVVVGREFGVRRTGAVGAVAADALARQDARVVGVIGSGRQAWGQLWGVAGVRALGEVRVFSPTPPHVARFVDEARRELELDSRPATSARAAVEGADVVIIATNSDRPVLEADWIGPGAHVTTVGPKSAHRHETPTALVDTAEVFAVDNPEQITALGARFFSARSPVPLAAILDRSEPGRRTDQEVTLFCSAGSPAADLTLLRLLAEV